MLIVLKSQTLHIIPRLNFNLIIKLEKIEGIF